MTHTVTNMASTTRFSALPFAYNARIALALVPPLVATLASSGPSGGVLAGLGCVLAYLLDVSRAPEATLVALWATLGAVYVCLTFGDVTLHTGGLAPGGPVPALAHVALVCLQGQTLFLVGVWATLQVRCATPRATALLLLSTHKRTSYYLCCLTPLPSCPPPQFKFLQLRAPRVVLACERVLLAAAPLNAGAVVAWTLVSGLLADVAPSTSPFTVSAYLLLMYFTLSTPLVSSFYARDVARSARGEAAVPAHAALPAPVDALVLAPQDASLHAANCVALPLGMYICLHRRALLSLPWTADVWMDDAASLALLAAGPPLAMCAAHRTALWWWTAAAPPADARPSSARGPPFQAAFTALAALAALGAHSRIALHSFRTFLTAAPPWDAVLTGIAAGCAVAVVSVARAHGGIGPALSDASGAAPFMAAAAAGGALSASLAVGIPLWLLPAPMVAATMGLSLWPSLSWAQATPHASLSLDPGAAARHRAGGSAGLGGRYALAVACGSACAGWFLHAHFMQLDHTLGDTRLPLSSLCLAFLASGTVAAAMPGLLAHIAGRREARPAVGALSVCVALHAFLMAWLESVMTAEDDAAGGTSGVYPLWLLATTTAVGLALPSYLRSRRAIHAWSAGLATWLAASKLPLLLFPQAGCKGVALAAQVLAAFASPFIGTASRRGAPLGVPRVLLHLLAWLATTFRARFLLFDLMFATTGHRPSDASLLATLCLLAGLFRAAMAPRCRPGAPLASALRKAAVGALLTALLVAALRPPMPWKGEVGFWYDAAHVPDPEPDDVAMYGAAGRAHQRKADGAPAWALILAASSTAASRVTGGSAVAFGTAAARVRGGGAAAVAAAGVAGATAGWYIATEFLPHQPSGVDDPTFLVCTALGCAACGALVTHITARGGGDALSWALLLVQSASLPLAIVHLHAGWLTAALHRLDHPRLTAQDAALLTDATATLLALSATLNILVAFAVRVRTAAALGAGGRRAGRSSSAGAQESKPDPFSPFAAGVGVAPRGPAGAAGGMPRALASMVSVGNACAWTAFVLVAALNEAVSRHADVSLLLCAPLLLLLTPPPVAAETAGYAAPVRAVWAALALKAGARMYATDRYLYPALRNGLCLAVTAPAWVLCSAFLAGARQPSVASRDSVFLLIAAPAQVLSLVLTDLPAVRVLACGALVLTLALQSASERRRAATARRL